MVKDVMDHIRSSEFVAITSRGGLQVQASLLARCFSGIGL